MIWTTVPLGFPSTTTEHDFERSKTLCRVHTHSFPHPNAYIAKPMECPSAHLHYCWISSFSPLVLRGDRFLPSLRNTANTCNTHRVSRTTEDWVGSPFGSMPYFTQLFPLWLHQRYGLIAGVSPLQHLWRTCLIWEIRAVVPDFPRRCTSKESGSFGSGVPIFAMGVPLLAATGESCSIPKADMVGYIPLYRCWPNVVEAIKCNYFASIKQLVLCVHPISSF